MKKFQKPRCPYCGRKISFPNAWFLKKQGEFLCPKCGGISNIVLDRVVYVLAFFTIFLTSIFFILAFFNIIQLNLWLILLIVIPYFLFFLISVFLVRLKKPVIRRRPKKPPVPERGPREGLNSGRKIPHENSPIR